MERLRVSTKLLFAKGHNLTQCWDDSIHDTSKWEDFRVVDIKPKPRGDYDVDIKIEYCGVCGSDVSCSFLVS